MLCNRCKRLVETRKQIVMPRVMFIGYILSNKNVKISLSLLKKNIKILIVGMNPGVEENEMGVAFVGRSGRLLDEALKESGLKNYEFFITNSVRCFAPAPYNQNSVEEIMNCLGFLEKEIDYFSPSKIMILGKQAKFAFSFINEDFKNNIRFNETIVYEKQKIFYTYHPSFILRNLSRKRQYIESIKNFIIEK